MFNFRAYSVYEASFFCQGAADAAAICQIQPPRTGNAQLALLRLSLQCLAAPVTKVQVGLVLPNNVPTPTAVSAVQGLLSAQVNGGADVVGADVGELVGVWDVPPTFAAAVKNYRQGCYQNIGDLLVWEWPEDLPLGTPGSHISAVAASGICIRNITGAGVAAGNVLINARWGLYGDI